MKRLLTIIVLLIGCRGESFVVLEEPAPLPPIDTCERAFLEGVTGSECVGLEMGCFEDVGCCELGAFCEAGTLIRVEDCGACERCFEDAECGAFRWCVRPLGECVLCPPADCPPCPDELVPAERNGCEICVCVPPTTECSRDEQCGDPAFEYCALGMICACDEDPSCCVNVCAPIECMAPEPPPEGCVRPCLGDPMCPTEMCRQVDCRCVVDHWECSSECAFNPVPEC